MELQVNLDLSGRALSVERAERIAKAFGSLIHEANGLGRIPREPRLPDPELEMYRKVHGSILELAKIISLYNGDLVIHYFVEEGKFRASAYHSGTETIEVYNENLGIAIQLLLEKVKAEIAGRP